MFLQMFAPLLSSSLSRPLAAVALVGAFALVAGAPGSADACGVPESGLTSTTPSNGATYPANAALLFQGFDITLDAVTVKVDDQPAELVPAGFASGWATIAVLVEPAPQVGQTVVVSGSFCEFGDCGPVTLTYTAGEPDLTAPTPVAEASRFTVYDHADFESSGGDCLSNSELTVYVRVMQDAPGAAEAPGVVSAVWSKGSGFFSDFTITSSETASMSVAIELSQLDGNDPRSEVCVTVVATDLAGNAAEPFEICPACFYRKDEGENDGGPVPEPAWTDADAVPGSACAVAVETTGEATDSGEPTTGGTGGETGEEPTSGEPQSTGEEASTGATDTSEEDDGGEKGCACDGGGGSPDLGALVVLGLGLGLRRRRR